MAIDNIPYREAHDLAYQQKGFYNVQIPVSHWQLRHYISAPEDDNLYYASGTEIYCLNTATKKRKHIATLPFEARCTASGYGWVCVGGEDEGHFATIKLDGSGPRTQEVDAALPIDTWRPHVGGRRAPTVKVERIGEEIVNSISIHRIQDEEAHLDDIVAVLTNNDKTVRIYSLPAGQETRVKDLPYAINHATISPDGQRLVAVGDYNQAYFWTRDIVDTPPQIPKPHNRLTSASVQWRLSSVVTLHVSGDDGPMGYFTTAWSPSGHLVAVGSEGGYITVIDADLLADPIYEDDAAIVAIVPGSRADQPPPHPGAIRSMIFSPEPLDLLVWAEDQGRICIGDLRSGLKHKQVVSLEPKEESLSKLTFEDVPGEEQQGGVLPNLNEFEAADLIRRYRNIPETNSVNFATEYLEARRRQQTAARQQRMSAQEIPNARHQTDVHLPRHAQSGEDSQGLTAREEAILEALRTTRQREEARANGQNPRSVNYTTPELFTSAGGRSSTPGNNQSARPISDILSSVQEALPELSRIHAASPQPSSSQAADLPNTLPPIRGVDEPTWGMTPVYESFSRLPVPQRRPSVVVSPPGSVSPGPGPSVRANNRPTSTTPADGEDENPWRTIEEHMAGARGPLFEGAARAQAGSPLPAPSSRDRTQEELDAQRRMTQAQIRSRERWRTSRMAAASNTDRPVSINEARRLAAFPEGYETLIRRAQRNGMGTRDVGVRTAGLAMSTDGRKLWAASESGIFEIDIMVKGRLFWPALEPR